MDRVDRELQVKRGGAQITSSKDARKKKNVMEFYFSAVRKLTLNSPATVQAHFQHQTLLWSLPHLHINVPPKHPSSEGLRDPRPTSHPLWALLLHKGPTDFTQSLQASQQQSKSASGEGVHPQVQGHCSEGESRMLKTIKEFCTMLYLVCSPFTRAVSLKPHSDLTM